MEKLVQYMVYKKNPLRQLGIIGFKASHLEADPIKNKKILDTVRKKYPNLEKMTYAQRSLAQFKCQDSLFTNNIQKSISWLIFALAAPVVLILLILKSLKRISVSSCDVFIFRLGDLEYVRHDFQNMKISTVPENEPMGNYLGSKELYYFFSVIFKNPSYFLSPKLIVNFLRWLSVYGWVLKHYNPKLIATFFEGTASCSLMTEYLNSLGVKHYNYAHGEHFRYECYSAFAKFNKYTIWGNHFKKIQIEKYEPEEMFVTRAPSIFKKFYNEVRLLAKQNSKQITVLIHSGVEKGQDEYQSLLNLLLELDTDWNVLLRPHPVDRSSWPQVMADLKQDLIVRNKQLKLAEELPEIVPMKESVTKSPIFVGSASAALLEALLAGCKVIYLTGRAKNNDIIERHQQSENVLSFKNSSSSEIKKFLSQPYLSNQSEQDKINYLFDFSE